MNAVAQISWRCVPSYRFVPARRGSVILLRLPTLPGSHALAFRSGLNIFAPSALGFLVVFRDSGGWAEDSGGIHRLKERRLILP
jgi:hypothetical protein